MGFGRSGRVSASSDDPARTADPAPLLDIEDVLESQPIGGMQIGVVLLVLTVMILDGMDLQILGLAAPRIIAEWHIQKAMLGPALAMTVVGMGFGALLGGWLGDRRGRKPTIVAALVLIGAASVACGFVETVAELALCRFVCGVGGGACFPGATAYIAEWLPRRKKSLAVGIITVGIPLGGMVGATLVIATLSHGGWRNAFLIGGLLPLGLAVAAQLRLAESPSWMVAKRKPDAEVRALLARALPAAPVSDARFMIVEPARAAGRATVLGPGDRRTSAGLWLAFYMNVLATSGIVTWGTLLLTTLGFQMAYAVSVVFLVNLVAAGTMLTCSVLTTRFGSRPLFLSATSSAIVAIAIVGTIAATRPTSVGVAVGVVAAGGLLFMNQTLLYILAAHAYPVEKRSIGVGIASLVSRFGSTTSALFGGVVLSLGSPLYFIGGLAGAALLAGVGALIVDRHVVPAGGRARARRRGPARAARLDAGLAGAAEHAETMI